MSSPIPKRPKISVVVLNYNGQQWLARCFKSLEEQTIFPEIEVIVSDNKSADGSDRYAAEWLERTGRGRVVQNGANLYYCEANNNGAAAAGGEFLLFLNNDTWLEPDCLEKLYNEVRAAAADAATPLVLNYDDESFQNNGGSGFDIFGLATAQKRCSVTTPILVACGCSLLISAEMFKKVGGFDPKLLIYVDETDLSMRVWIAGGKVVNVPASRLHHRGAAVVNPSGQTKMVESRTTDSKRFLATRNGVLFWMKNGQHILLFMLVPHLVYIIMESLFVMVLTRRWSFFRRSCLDALVDCWRLRGHVAGWRARIRTFRRRGDFWMLRFFRLVPSRWSDIKMFLRVGPPKIEAR